MILLSRKLFFVLFVLIFLFVFATQLVKNVIAAPGDVFDQTIQQKVDDEKAARTEEGANGPVKIFSTRVNKTQLSDTVYNLSGMIGCVTDDPTICKPEQTALGAIASSVTTLYTHPPASGIAYTQDALANAGFLAKPAFAQGIGFAGLSPLLPLWKITRNIAYLVIILVMVAIGFMVIFRMKIDPKTVISVQAAVPKIVLSLILITLSYPIVGFMVDLMYVLMALLISIIANGTGQAGRIPEYQSYYMNAHWVQLLGTVMGGGFSVANDFLYGNIGNGTVSGGAELATALIVKFLAGSFWGGAAILPGLFVLILFLGLLFTFVRIFLLLLNSYIQLLISLVLGPLQLLAEAIPGRSAFTEWLLNVIANLIVFPTTAAVLMFAEYLAYANMNTEGLFSPPFIGVPGKGVFPAFLSLGIFFLAPQLIAQVKKMFHPKPILPISVGTAFAPLTGGVQTATGAASQFYYFNMTAQNIPILKNLFGGGGTKPH